MYRYALLLGWLIPTVLFAQSTAKIPDPDPEIERKTFILPEGFEVNLFAADPLLAKPIQMNFDPQGRLWVASSETYPQIKPGEKANDKIIILEDTKGVGRADKVTVFADGLLIPTGVEPGDGGAYVANSTELLHLSASKPGGKADKTRVVLSGFGTEDTHHILHTLRWGPEGMLYFNQSTYIHSHIETPHGVRHLNGGGIWQFRPETMQLEVFVRGYINPWGHHFDRYGQSFATDGANGEGITHNIPGAAYSWAIGVPKILHGLNPGSPKHCGLEVLSGSHLPEDWRGNMLTADFRGHRVCRFVLKDDGSTYASQEKAELIKSNHPAFRPIDIKMGPDGAIYVADWYNPIIQHGEIDFRDPRRDHTHGRIWRITAKTRPLVQKVDLSKATIPELLDRLKAPEDWTRHNAKRVLKERGLEAVSPELNKWLAKQQDEHDLLEGFWVFQALDCCDSVLLTKLLQAKDFRVRAAATRVLGLWPSIATASMLSKLVVDEHPRVRLEAVRALSNVKTERAVEEAMTALDKPMDRVLEYALWMTARDLEPQWAPAFAAGKLDFGGNARHLTFALQAVGTASAMQPLLALLKSGKIARDRQESVWSLVASLGGAAELQAVFDRALLASDSTALQAALLSSLEQAMLQRHLKPAGDLARLKELFATNSDAVRPVAYRLAGLWKLTALRNELQAAAAGEKSSQAVRQAAFEGLANFNDKLSTTYLGTTAATGTTIEIRGMAIVALSSLDVAAAAVKAADLLATVKADDSLLDLFAALLSRKGGGVALSKALEGKKLSPDVAKLGIRAVRASVQDMPMLVEALNKAGDLAAQKRDLTKPEVEALVAEVQKTGNAARGEILYRRADMQCLKCHAIGGAGGQVGPDLASIGASAPIDYLIDSLLLPNKAIKEGFHSLRIETVDGKVHTGIKIRESKTELALRTADDKEIVIQVKDIEDKRNSRSLMPDGLVDTLTRNELADVVKFLSELGKLGPYSLSKARIVRRWQVLQPTPDAVGLIRKSRVAAVAENDPAFQWNSTYSMVSGELPLDAAVPFTVWKDTAPMAVFRCQLDVTAAGKVKLKLNSAAGISLLVGSNPVDAMDETMLDLPAGTQTLLFAIDLSKRKEPLRVELEDVEGSSARVNIVGGK